MMVACYEKDSLKKRFAEKIEMIPELRRNHTWKHI
jgi:hypothetical protein